MSKLRSNEKLGAENNQSRETVRRFIRLTNLIPELLDMVDNKTVSFNPAVELSYLSPEQQQEVIRAMDDTQNFPSVSQAKRIKKLAQDGTFTTETVVAIMGEEKKSELDTVTNWTKLLSKTIPCGNIFPAVIRPNRWKIPSSSCWSSGRKSVSTVKNADRI